MSEELTVLSTMALSLLRAIETASQRQQASHRRYPRVADGRGANYWDRKHAELCSAYAVLCGHILAVTNQGGK